MAYAQMSTAIPWSLIKGGFHKSSKFQTLVIETAAGLGTSALSQQPYPTWTFDVDLNAVSGSESQAGSVLQAFLDCYNQVNGRGALFLFTDPNDSTVALSAGVMLNRTPGASVPMGQSGDGTSTIFQLARTIGSSVDILQSVTGLLVKVNGTTKALGTDYSVDAKGLVTFVVAPAAAATITWSGSFQYLCRFKDDNLKSLARVNRNAGGFLWDCSVSFESEFV